MELADKSLVLDVLRMPRLGLSPEQIRKIESVIDGRPPTLDLAPRPWISYQEAARLLGYKTKRAVAYQIKDGALDAYVPKGKTNAIGVTRESLERVLGREVLSCE